MSNEISIINEYLTIKEFAALLKISIQGAWDIIKKLNIPTFDKENFDKNGKKIKPIKTIKYTDYLVFKEQQQQLEIRKDINKSNQITNNFTDDQVLLAFGNTLENKNPDEILKLSFQLFQVASVKTKEFLEKENKELKIQLDRDNEYYTIKRVSILNGKTQKDYDWRKLKNKSLEFGKEIKAVPDNNYGLVKSYHIDVWKQCYPNERY